MENMGFKNQKKRKRTRGRKMLIDSFMDMAEARREIVNALHLHRSSSSMPSCDTRHGNTLNYCNKIMPSSIANTTSSQLYYPVVESTPFHEPVWSTTAPAATATLLEASPPLDQDLEFVWPENNLSSSYTWWIRFLRSLDSGNNSDQLSKCHYSFQENVPAGSETNSVSLDENEQSPSPDACDWLTNFTTAEDEVELMPIS